MFAINKKPTTEAYKPKHDIKQLFDILRIQRPAGSDSDESFVNNKLLTITGALQDEYGNVFVPVRMDESTTMFSCHTDTVHPKPHADFKNKLQLDNITNHVFTDGTSQLGADDGTGIWFMLNMIDANIPGLYAFHRDEEVGGIGSTASAEDNAKFIEDLGIERCIAFDRHYFKDVITHQGTRCASDAFALALSKELNQSPGFAFEPCDGGVFTDSANYTHLIPECTNISVGYWKQHTLKETQDVAFADKLLDRLLQIDWEALPTVRDCVLDNESAWEPDWKDTNYNFYNNPYEIGSHATSPYSNSSGSHYIDNMDIVDMLEEFPLECATIMENWGISEDALRKEIREQKDMLDPTAEHDSLYY
jgi:hypothetical protein